MAAEGKHYLQLVSFRGGGASEQLGGGARRSCKTHPTACSPRKIFELACSEIESGAIWRHLKPSKLTQISGVK